MNDNDNNTTEQGTPRHLVFVYGSLLSGLGNHDQISDGELVGTGTIDGEYKMINLGAFPAVYRAAGGGPVVGEVYAVSDATRRRLDRLEGNGRFYTREQVAANVPTGTTATVWVYLINNNRHFADASRVENNDWRTDRCVRS